MSLRKGNHWRFSLSTLLLGTTAAAILCAVLPYPYVAFYTLLALFFLAAVLARCGPHSARRFWFWFSLLGWTYVLVGSLTLDWVESGPVWSTTREWLRQHNPGPAGWTPTRFLLLGHFLVAICVATTGAALLSTIARRGAVRRSERTAVGSSPAPVTDDPPRGTR